VTAADLPAGVRARVVALAGERLGAMAPDLVPAPLRAVARFTPAKRARLGATPLAAAVATDPVFRQGVAELARTRFPELAAALVAGEEPDTPVEEAAALAYLLRSPGWEQLLARAEQELGAREAQQAGSATLDAVVRLTEQLEAVRATGRAELAAAREQARLSAAELNVVRRKVREMGDRAGRAEHRQREADAALAQAQAELAGLRDAREQELRVLREQLADAERAVQGARSAAREGRQDDQLRLRLLLDALVGAAQGLRRELALPPAEGRPADSLAGDYVAGGAAGGAAGPGPQGRSDDDPALLDALLAVPATHLLVDGYNVTKTGYGGLALEAQRGRLLAGLGALASRTGAEVTVVFDGSDGAVPVALPAPRGVRLLFSRTGETADEVVRRLVRHEPQGRPVVVASSDKEVADGVRRAGARPVAALALVRLLDRSVGPRS
jgi:predicted RNA-binding protein with PIN domain